MNDSTKQSIVTRRGFLQSMGLIVGTALVAPSILAGDETSPEHVPPVKPGWERISETVTGGDGKRYTFSGWVRRSDFCKVVFEVAGTQIVIPAGLPQECKIYQAGDKQAADRDTILRIQSRMGSYVENGPLKIQVGGNASYVDLDDVAIFTSPDRSKGEM